MVHQHKLTVHGTAVALPTTEGMSAVLLRGPSGVGKSDLAFRLIEGGGTLICDDQVLLERHQDMVMAKTEEVIRGLLEVRGLGLIRYPTAPATCLRLVVDLAARADIPRLPDWISTAILGVNVPLLRLHAFDMSTPQKIIKALELVQRPELLVK